MVHKTRSEINSDSQVEVSKSGCLDFGDLTGGSAKSLPLKLLNRTHATVPIRLVISAVSPHITFVPILKPLTNTHKYILIYNTETVTSSGSYVAST